METGFISRASGSAYAEYKNTKLVVSVSGPRPTGAGETFNDVGILHCHFKYCSFARRDCRKSYLPDEEEKEYSVIMEEALSSCLCLEKYPKSRFDCFIQVLEDDGSVVPAAITAGSLAFADAGIELFDLVTACSAALVKGKGDNECVILDPTWEEQEKSIGMLTLVYSPSLSSITNLLQTGYFTGPQLAEVSHLPLILTSSLILNFKNILIYLLHYIGY